MRSIQETLPWEDAALKIRCFTLRGRLGVPSYCHWHNEVEIVYSRTGSGIQQVHETSYVLAPGALPFRKAAASNCSTSRSASVSQGE